MPYRLQQLHVEAFELRNNTTWLIVAGERELCSEEALHTSVDVVGCCQCLVDVVRT